MSYIPGAGLKKPLNVLTQPVFPDIRKGPPEFKWSGKHWKVDTGATLRDTETFTQFSDPAVLAVSRDYNKTIYGQTSFKNIVNAEFRPPLSNVYEDDGPLNRLPWKLQAVVPRINPGTAWGPSGTSSYTADNDRTTEIPKAITDKIKVARTRPTIYCPIDIPLDNSVLPDFQTTIPNVSAFSGWYIPVEPAIEHKQFELNEKITTGLNPGSTTSFTYSDMSNSEGYKLPDIHPRASATAGTNVDYNFFSGVDVTPGYFDDVTPIVSADAGYNPTNTAQNQAFEYEFGYNTPIVSTDAGYNGITTTGVTHIPVDLSHTSPEYSASAGYNGITTINDTEMSTNTIELSNRSPNISASAGYNGWFTSIHDAPDVHLRSKLGYVPFHVNPEMTGHNEIHEPTVDDHLKTPKQLSYYVPPTHGFQANNNTKKMHFRSKLDSGKSYGSISQTGANYSSFKTNNPGLESFSSALKKTSTKKDGVYSF